MNCCGRREFLQTLGHIAGFGVLASLTGCSAAQKVEQVNVSKGLLELGKGIEQFLDKCEKPLDEFLKMHFTEKAREKLEDIPVLEGFVISKYYGYAAGYNIRSSLISIFQRGDHKRAVIISRNHANYLNEGIINEGDLIHEYIHHLEGLGMIDHDDCIRNYKKMRKDPEYDEREKYIESEIENRNFLEWFFGLSDNKERIALVGADMALGSEYPDYMKEVYKDVLTFKYKKWIE